MNHPESDSQCAVMEWFKYQYARYAGYIFSIPNSAHLAGSKKQRAIKMSILKKEGLLPGVSDFFLAIPMRHYHGMFCEMKSESGRLSDEQREFLARMQSVGYYTCVAKSFEEAQHEIEVYLGKCPDGALVNQSKPFKLDEKSKRDKRLLDLILDKQGD